MAMPPVLVRVPGTSAKLLPSSPATAIQLAAPSLKTMNSLPLLWSTARSMGLRLLPPLL